MNTIAIQFIDNGEKVVTSRRALRKYKGEFLAVGVDSISVMPNIGVNKKYYNQFYRTGRL